MSEIWTSHKLTEVRCEKNQLPEDKQLLQEMDAALKELVLAHWEKLKLNSTAPLPIDYEQYGDWLVATIGTQEWEKWVAFTCSVDSMKKDKDCCIRGMYASPQTAIELIKMLNQQWNLLSA